MTESHQEPGSLPRETVRDQVGTGSGPVGSGRDVPGRVPGPCLVCQMAAFADAPESRKHTGAHLRWVYGQLNAEQNARFAAEMELRALRVDMQERVDELEAIVERQNKRLLEHERCRR